MQRQDQHEIRQLQPPIEQVAVEQINSAGKRGGEHTRPAKQQRRATLPQVPAASRYSSIRRALTTPSGLRQALVVAEILGPPTALHPREPDDTR